VVLGAGVAAVALGITMGVLARQTQADFDAAAQQLITVDDAHNLEDLAARGREQALIANVGWGLGAVALAAGTTLLVLDLTLWDDSDAAPSANVTPIVSPEVAGLLWSVRF